MTRQVLDLTGLDHQSGWRGAVLIDPAFIAGGGIAYLRHIERVGNSIRVRLGATETGAPLDAGPEFTVVLETHDEALTFAGSDGATLVLKGPGHGDNSFADPTEPYFWTPDNGAAMSAWFSNRAGDFTLTLDDGVAEVVRDVSGTAAASAAQAAATVERVAQLTLADFDDAGLETDVLALIRAGAGSGGIIFATPPRGTVGALLAGELGLGADEAAITRIRRRNGNMLAFNDNDPLSLATYFGPGGGGADLTLYVQTVDGVASLPVSTSGSAGGNFVQFGPLGADLDTLVDDIGDGQSFIVAFTRPAVTAIAVRGETEAGGAETAATVARHHARHPRACRHGGRRRGASPRPPHARAGPCHSGQGRRRGAPDPCPSRTHRASARARPRHERRAPRQGPRRRGQRVRRPRPGAGRTADRAGAGARDGRRRALRARAARQRARRAPADRA